MLLCTAYNVYVEILRKKLKEEVEEKNLLPERQEGFRRGRGIIVNIFILNHLVQKEKKEKDKRIFAAFIDLRAAFDNMDEGKVWSLLRG